MKIHGKVIISGLVIAAISFGGYSALANKDTKKEYQRYLQQQVEQQVSEAYDDAVHSFNFDTGNYKLYLADKTKEIEGMSKSDYAGLRISMHDAIFTTNKMKKGDFVPAIYVKDSLDEAVVMVKAKDGTNSMFTFKKEGENWELVDEQEQDGKEIPEEKAKTFEEFSQENSESE